LQVRIPDIGVFVDGGFVDHLFRRQGGGPGIDHPKQEQAVPGGNVAHIPDRIKVGVHGVAKGVPQRPGPDHRPHHIGAISHAPAAEGLAEVFLMFFQPRVGGHIEETENPHRGVNQETPRIGSRILGLALKQVVHRDKYITHVGEEIAHPEFYRVRKRRIVALGHRLQHRFVQAFIEGEHGAVEALPRIPGILSRSAAPQNEQGRQQQGKGSCGLLGDFSIHDVSFVSVQAPGALLFFRRIRSFGRLVEEELANQLLQHHGGLSLGNGVPGGQHLFIAPHIQAHVLLPQQTGSQDGGKRVLGEFVAGIHIQGHHRLVALGIKADSGDAAHQHPGAFHRSPDLEPADVIKFGLELVSLGEIGAGQVAYPQGEENQGKKADDDEHTDPQVEYFAIH